MSIFISIASYQDPLLVSTIFSAYENAENKNDLIFGICDQSDNSIKVNEITFSDQIHYDHLDPLFSRGPCWARHRAQSFFNEEDFFLQVDSHTQFAPKWDSIFIKQLEKISANQEIDEYFKKPIITSYPRSFKVLDFENGLFRLHHQSLIVLVNFVITTSLFSHSPVYLFLTFLVLPVLNLFLPSNRSSTIFG